MKRKIVAAATGALALVLLGAPPGATQACGGYQQPACTTTTTVAPTTSTALSPTTVAPDPNRESADTDREVVAPGDQVTVTGTGTGPIAGEGAEIDVNLAPADGSGGISVTVQVLTDPDGNISGVQLTIPADTPDGLYFIEVTVTDPDGTVRVLIAPLVVRATTSASAAAAENVVLDDERGEPGVDYWIGATIVRVSPALQRIQASITSIGEEEALVASVVEGRAELAVIDGDLVVSRGGDTEAAADDTRPLVAALALGIAASGLVLIRRRRVPLGTNTER